VGWLSGTWSGCAAAVPLLGLPIIVAIISLISCQIAYDSEEVQRGMAPKSYHCCGDYGNYRGRNGTSI
jgi:hypothetical protein